MQVRVTRALEAMPIESYLERKIREIALMNRCLATPLDLSPPDSAAKAIDQ